MKNALDPGVAVPVDVAAIENELRSLWKSASDQEGEGAVIRACSCNLVVFTDRPAAVPQLLEVIDSVSQHHPGRSLMAVADASDEMRAWISARCSIPISGGPQVCSEVIILAGGVHNGEAVANTLLSLLVPDLPVYLYLPSFGSAGLDLAMRLAPWSTMLLLDSQTGGIGSVSGSYLLGFMASPPLAIEVRDLEWARITHWRDHVAQLFDGPEGRQLAAQISEVEIRALAVVPNETPTGALLLAGWLCVGLAWQVRSVNHEGNRLAAALGGSSGEVSLSILTTEASDGEKPVVRSLVLRTRDGDSCSFCLDGQSGCVLAVSGFAAGVSRSVPHTDSSESELLVGELAYSGKDAVFQQALQRALQIVGRPAQ